MKKILIIRFSSIGDIVLTSPIIRCVKQQIPDCELHFAVKKSFSSLVSSNPYINKVHLLDKDDNLLIKQLKNENFDAIIDLHTNIRTLKIKFLLQKKSYSFPKLNFQKFLLTHFKINTLPKRHVVDRYFQAVKKIGVKNDFESLDFFIPKDIVLSEEILVFISSKKPIAIAIGGNHYTKQIPTEMILELLEKNDNYFILLGGLEDLKKASIIQQNFPERIMVLCGKISIDQSALVMKNCDIVVTSDTGLMHIAAALNINIISVWGNTVPEFGMYPYMPQSPKKYKILEVNNLKCRPCSKIGHSECPQKHFDCMLKQNFDNLFSAK